MATPQTILLSTPHESGGASGHAEYPAGGNIPVGSLVALNSSGNVVVHGTLGAWTLPWFAKEDPLRGYTIASSYVSGDIVPVHKASKEDVIYALIATSQTVVIGAALMSNGDGTLAVKTSTNTILATARDAITTTGAVGNTAVIIA